MDRYGGGAESVSGFRLASAITPLVITALALAGCASSQSESTPISASPTTTAQVRTECTAVAAAAQNLGNQFAALAAGQASRDQVQAAAQELRSSLDAAQSVIKPESQADADAARAALQQLQTALDTQPIDLAAVRTAVGQTLEAVGRVVAVCAPGSTPTVGPLPPEPTS